MIKRLKSRIWTIVEWFNDREWAIIVVAFFVAFPVSLFGVAQYVKPVEDFLKNNPGAATWMGIIWPAVVMGGTAIARACKPPREGGNLDEVLQLIECLKEVVGQKVKRFEAFLEKQKSLNQSQDVFGEITQPDEQIAHIVAGVFSYFEGTLSRSERTDKVKIRVALARMGPKYIEGWECYYPTREKPRSELLRLQCDSAGFSRAKTSKRMSTVESILEEKSRRSSKAAFTVTDESRKDEDGSIICYPIKLKGTNEVPFVLSISASKPRHFKRKEEIYYQSILENFEQRIVLEYCLKQIKRNREGALKKGDFKI